MSNETEQVAQRQAKLDALVAMGVTAYPNTFDRTAAVSAIKAEHNEKTGEALDATHVIVRTAGRILGMRAFGKANFVVLSDGLDRLQVYVRADSVPELDFKIYQHLDLDVQYQHSDLFKDILEHVSEMSAERASVVLGYGHQLVEHIWQWTENIEKYYEDESNPVPRSSFDVARD